jgi:hypothetical protein
MVNYAEKRLRQNSDPNRKAYGNLTNNCMTFCSDVAESGGASTPLSLVDWPNQDIGELQNMYPSIRFDPKKDKLGGMLYMGDHIKAWLNKTWEKITGD